MLSFPYYFPDVCRLRGHSICYEKMILLALGLNWRSLLMSICLMCLGREIWVILNIQGIFIAWRLLEMLYL